MIWNLDSGWLMMTVATVGVLAFFFGSALDAIMREDGFGPTGNTSCSPSASSWRFVSQLLWVSACVDLKLAVAGALAALSCLSAAGASAGQAWRGFRLRPIMRLTSSGVAPASRSAPRPVIAQGFSTVCGRPARGSAGGGNRPARAARELLQQALDAGRGIEVEAAHDMADALQGVVQPRPKDGSWSASPCARRSRRPSSCGRASIWSDDVMSSPENSVQVSGRRCRQSRRPCPAARRRACRPRSFAGARAATAPCRRPG